MSKRYCKSEVSILKELLPGPEYFHKLEIELVRLSIMLALAEL